LSKNHLTSKQFYGTIHEMKWIYRNKFEYSLRTAKKYSNSNGRARI